jgi:arylsulfatase A-like enzyme
MRHLLVTMIALACAGQPTIHAATPPKPNIVLILADDLGYADVGFTQPHGSQVKTPNLDRLAAGGARIEAFYTLPVCTPSRCALMTGRHPIRYGRQFNVLRPGQRVGLSLNERLLPQALREAGYATVHIGKWHLGEFDPAYLPLQRGFDHTYGLRPDHRRLTHLPSGGDDLQRDGQPCADQGSLTHLLTSEAVRRIEQRDPARPLFLYVAYHAPHTPLECLPEFSQPYEHLGPTRGPYAGLIAEMDAGVGRVVDAVEKQGLRENTLFIFASDNGGLTVKGDIARNDPLRGGKGSLYEGGVRVAAFATWDGRIPAGTVVKQPLHMVDWYPTLLTLAGAPFPQGLPLDGRNAWPTITEGKPSPHDTILINTLGREGALRMGDWKLVRNGTAPAADEDETAPPAGDRRTRRQAARNAPDVYELFNLSNDPAEARDLAKSEPERMLELSTRLDAFAREAVPPILKPAQDQPAAKPRTRGGKHAQPE